MWTLIILMGLATIGDARFLYPPKKFETEQACVQESAGVLKEGFEHLAKQFGKGNVFVVGRCVENFQRQEDPDNADPVMPNPGKDPSPTPNTDGQNFR